MKKILLIVGIFIFAFSIWAGTSLALREGHHGNKTSIYFGTESVSAADSVASGSVGLVTDPTDTPVPKGKDGNKDKNAPSPTPAPTPATPSPTPLPSATLPPDDVAASQTPTPTPAEKVALSVPQELKSIARTAVDSGPGLNIFSYLAPNALYESHGLNPQTTRRAYAFAGILAILGLSAMTYGRRR